MLSAIVLRQLVETMAAVDGMIERAAVRITADERREFRPFLAQLVGDMTQRGAGLRAIGLNESLTQCRGDHRLLGLPDVGQRVAGYVVGVLSRV